MVRYVRYSDRFGPITPIVRTAPYRENDEPADREWVRMLFDKPKAARGARAFTGLHTDMPDAPLYDESGQPRHPEELAIGTRVDVMT